MTRTTAYRLGLTIAVGTVLFLLLGAGALGIIGAGGRPDLMYLGVVAVGVVGALAARLRARGMAVTLLAMAATQVATSAPRPWPRLSPAPRHRSEQMTPSSP